MKGNNWLQGAIATPPEKPETPSVGHPTDGDGIGQQPTTPGAFWFYKISQELDNFISNSGLTPTDDELDQFWQAANLMLSSTPVGTITFVLGDQVPTGTLKLNSPTLLRANYPALFAYAQQQTNFVSQAVKDADYDTYAGYFGDGDGSTTFTLPDARGETFRVWDDGRGVDVGREIGSWQDFAIENITGSLTSYRGVFSNNSGAFTRSGSATVFDGPGGIAQSHIVNFDASNVVKTANETRARSLAVMDVIKY
jgi:hypothetical protein